MPQYEIYKSDTLYAIVKERFAMFSHKIDISGVNRNILADGDLGAMDFTISCDGNIIGELSKKFFSFGDFYRLYIKNPEDAPFFTALSIAIDNCHHNNN